MENIRKRRIIEILVFFAIVACSFAVFKPASDILEKRLAVLRDKLIYSAEKEYGITIKYGRMSPAFFRKIMIRDVSIYDAETGGKIADFALIYVNYRILELIKRNPAAVISSIGIYDGLIDFSTSKNKNVWERITGGKYEDDAIKIEAERETENDVPLVHRIEYAITQFQNKIETANLILRNILINYSNEHLKAECYISDGIFNVMKEKTEFNLNSYLHYHNVLSQNFSDLKTDINISGSLYQKNLSASSIINFSNIKSGNIAISKISVFASYLHNMVSVTTLQDIHPIDINASWNILNNSAKLNIECKDLQPFALVFQNEENSILNELKNAELSGFVNISLSEKQELTWNTKLNAELPPLNLGKTKLDKSSFVLDALGDDNVIQINNFAAAGQNLNAALSGSYKIKEILPDFKIDIANLKLPSTEALSMQLNITSNAKNIFASIPEISFGDAKLYNVKSIFEKKQGKTDFLVSLNDEAGNFSFDGTWTHPDKNSQNNNFGYLELHGTLDSVSIKNFYTAVNAAQKKDDKNSIIKNFIEPIKMTSEFYASSDFKSFSYNVIQTVLASSVENGFYTLFSLKGNESSLDINGLDLMFSKLHLKGGLNASFESGGAVFDSTITLNDIAYKTSGIYENDSLTIFGDYGLNANVLIDKNKKIKSSFQVREFPVPFLNSAFSTDLLFEYDNSKNWNFICNFAKLEHLNQTISGSGENLEFEIAGEANPNKVFFHKVKAGRKNLQLEGTASFNSAVSSEDNINVYHTNISLFDSLQQEKFIFDSQFYFLDKLYFDGKCSIDNISLERFFVKQKKENRINAEAVFLGSPDAVSLKAELKEFDFNVNGKNLSAEAVAVLDDKEVFLSGTNIEWGNHKIHNIAASLTPETGAGTLSFDYALLNLKDPSKETKASFGFEFNSTVNPKDVPNTNIISKLQTLVSHYTVSMKISDWMVSGKEGTKTLTASLVREPNIIAVYAGEGDKIYGFKTDDGTVSLHIDKSLPINLNLDGTFTKDFINLNCSDISIDMPFVMDYIPETDIVKFDTGEITGALDIKGTQKDPLFFGELTAAEITGSSPKYSPDAYGKVSVPILFEGTNLTVPHTVVPGKTGRLWAEVDAEFIGWVPYYTTIRCGTVDDDVGLLSTKNLAFHANGNARCALVIEISPSRVNLEGSAYFDNGYFSVPFNDLYKISEKYSGSGMDFTMKLKLGLGKKTEFRYPSTDFPLLRAVTYTDEPMLLSVGTTGEKFEITGSSKIRTGELFYIKRNFYIKEGNLNFVKSPTGTEPIISLRAEIRDKLASGEPVTISLKAQDQYLDVERFNPSITTSPPMSDSERMALMGQVAIGDANKSNVLKEALSNASDIFAQMGLFKRAEASVRDFFHLDVLSLRTLVLQNVILGNLFNSSPDTPLTIGNYFDNTSVYIGKYLGSAIYADAMLHLSYYDPKAARNDKERRPVYGNLLFQPEIGLEMNTPFFLLRWHIAPSRPDKMFVPDAGITLSWKFFY